MVASGVDLSRTLDIFGLMVELHTVTAFALVTLGLFLIPGPAVLMVSASPWAMPCIPSWPLLVSRPVLMTSALAFDLVKYLGAGYLIYLGVRSLFEKFHALDPIHARPIGAATAFRQAHPRGSVSL